jgi:hypothetical protein
VEAIDEIISYQPLYSTRKQMQEKGYEYTVEKMKDTVIHILNMYFGRNNGQEK